MTSHNPQSSFAHRSPPPAVAAIARGVADASTVHLPSPYIVHHDHQMTPHSKGWGNPLGASCAETLAGRQGLKHGLEVVSTPVSVSLAVGVCPTALKTGPGACNALGHFFSINLQLPESHFQCVSQADPSHSKNSGCYVPTRSNGDFVNARNIVGEIRNV